MVKPNRRVLEELNAVHLQRKTANEQITHELTQTRRLLMVPRDDSTSLTTYEKCSEQTQHVYNLRVESKSEGAFLAVLLISIRVAISSSWFCRPRFDLICCDLILFACGAL